MAVYVIDEIMGRGKTSAMINHINQSSPEERYLFITPFLTEVDRIQSACKDREFESPKKEGGKLNNIKPLLSKKRNIVTTHELFKRFDDEILSLIESGGYTLIVDEAIDAIQKVEASAYDFKVLNERFVSVGEDKKVTWNVEDYSGRFSDYMELLTDRNVYAYNDTNWVSMIPVEFFESFKNVYLMTYMFGDQMLRCYLDLKGVKCSRLYVTGEDLNSYIFTDEVIPHPAIDFTNLIHIELSKKLNRIGDGHWALSKNWYKRHYDSEEMTELKNNLYNFFRNKAGTPSELNLWTTFGAENPGKPNEMDFQKKLSGKGYARGFLACNARGTNKYKHCVAAAYLVNRFPDTGIHNFLHSAGIEHDADRFALSEMLQWIWRTAIRDGKEIYLYIPSERMRNLLIQWMDDVKNGKE